VPLLGRESGSGTRDSGFARPQRLFRFLAFGDVVTFRNADGRDSKWSGQLIVRIREGVCPFTERLGSALHDDRDPPIAWVERIVGIPQTGVGKAANGVDLASAQTADLHRPARGIRAVGREFPVAVTIRRRIGAAVGVAFDRNRVPERAQLRRNHAK